MRRWDLDNLHIAGEDWDHVTSQIHDGKTTRSARVESYNDIELQQSFLKLAIDQLDIPTSTQYLPRDEPHELEVVDKLPCPFFPVWGPQSLSCQPRKEST